MTMRMLIDARHREETRVAVVKGNRIEEFDFESAEHKQLKGNIYLAKVTRVEPSLQAAFIDYGGNRHGFLAFSEIHPDYYQIPKEDREALLREEAEHAAEEERLRSDEDEFDDEDAEEAADDTTERDEDRNEDDGDGDETAAPPPTASGNGVDEGAAENLRQRRLNLRRRYKIQDVIKRRQVLLVQVVKEERGNKGAALTTYLSLAGRYCVLMPNTSHGGGISRKISNAADRKRLKSIMAELNLPRTMGCIVRTAGLQRTKVEIRRDFDYLARLWDEIRDTTLGSSAPALIYQDSDLIKRAIRDIYNKDIDEVIVEGEEGYRHAKAFMKLLMPSHVRRLKAYADVVPLFQRNHVEEQLSAMYQPVVQLKSGGYLVINPTEALVSIDINSGRSTREHGIEATAVSTNLEAAHEIARQLRLRDMAGLVVIDFIDMENNSNVRKVEKAMKGALSDDRARIQVGRISSFGLMEMSRQRLRTGVLEASTRQCPHCEGTGLVRTASSAGLSALRMLEDEAGRGRGSKLVLTASKEAALYVLNRKRAELAEIEARYGVLIEVASDNEEEGARMTVEVSGPPPVFTPRIEPPVIEDDDDDIVDEEIEEEEEEEAVESNARSESGEAGGRRRRRRRGRRGQRDETGRSADDAADSADDQAGEEQIVDERGGDEAEGGEEGSEAERKRRGRRGGRRRRGRGGAGLTTADTVEATETGVPTEPAIDESDPAPEPQAQDAAVEPIEAVEPVEKPKRGRRPKAATDATQAADATAEDAPAKPKRSRKKAVEPEAEAAPATEASATEAVPVADVTPDAAPAKPRRTRKKAVAVVEAEANSAPDEPESAPAEATNAPAEPTPDVPVESTQPTGTDDVQADAQEPVKRGGWWQRTFGT